MRNSQLIFGSGITSADQIIERFSSSTVADQSQAIGTFQASPDIARDFCRLANSFSSKRSDLLAAYLLGKADEDAVTQALISEYFSSFSPISAEDFLSRTSGRDEGRWDVILRYLSTLNRRKSVNILGYGADSCDDEKRISKFLVEQGVCDEVAIFRFNPYSNHHPPGVIDLDPIDLGSSNGPYFDIVLAFWTLHHVVPEFRWSQFGSCAQRIAPGGRLIILEEGSLDNSRAQSPVDRAYDFIVLCKDIIVNRALRPEWFDRPQDFYAMYLGNEDLVAIESYFPRAFSQYMRRPRNSRQVVDETLVIYSFSLVHHGKRLCPGLIAEVDLPICGLEPATVSQRGRAGIQAAAGG